MDEDVPTPANIDRKTDEIRASIRESLTAHGEAHVDVHDIRISLQEWRKLARAAARELRRPIETVATERKAWAVLRDWPSNPEERRIQDAAMKRAAEAMAFPTLE